MLRAAERRLADRIATGAVELVPGNSVALRFGDATFSAGTAIYAPAKATVGFRVLRPGGCFVLADLQPGTKPTGVRLSPTACVAWGRRATAGSSPTPGSRIWWSGSTVATASWRSDAHRSRPTDQSIRVLEP